MWQWYTGISVRMRIVHIAIHHMMNSNGINKSHIQRLWPVSSMYRLWTFQPRASKSERFLLDMTVTTYRLHFLTIKFSCKEGHIIVNRSLSNLVYVTISMAWNSTIGTRPMIYIYETVLTGIWLQRYDLYNKHTIYLSLKVASNVFFHKVYFETLGKSSLNCPVFKLAEQPYVLWM